MNIQIIYEDTHILVCHKPSGVPVQTSKIGAVDMVSYLKGYLYKKQEEKREPYLAVIHRLDQPVEGLLVFAKTPLAAKELNKYLQQHAFGKYYRATLCGEPKEKEARLENYLRKDAKTNTSFVCNSKEKDAKKAVLFYEVESTYEEEGQKYTKVKIQLETGRHHQIRVQMANMGCPIWGDTKYNPFVKKDKGWQKIALCAYRLEFIHPKTKEKMQFEI